MSGWDVTSAWRVQPMSPPGLAVMVDAWDVLNVDAPDRDRDRVDLIAERVRHPDEREVRIFASGLDVPPPLPPGFTPIATVRVPRGATAIHASMIGGS